MNLSHLSEKIILKTYKKNVTVFSTILKSSDIVNIATTEWETKFKQSYAELQKIWRS